MLTRSYIRFFTKKNIAHTCLEWDEVEPGLVKEVALLVSLTPDQLESEAGVHRLTRISPFCAENKPQTSFALVTVEPEPPEVPDFVLSLSEVRIDVFRAKGHGGQGVNTTDSAVRAVHTPTGTVATCQNTRSQHTNKEFALRVLAQRVKALGLTGNIRRAGTGWGESFRSYVLNGKARVKDSRSGVADSRPAHVLEGNMENLVYKIGAAV